MKKKFSKCMIHSSKREPGFTLLLAAIVSSIVLSLGAAIFSIALKQLTLTSTGRDSQFAFYAADTGAECALYWDVRQQAFATSSDSHVPGQVTCNETANTPATIVGTPTATAATTTFQYNFIMRDPSGAFLSGNCVTVFVAKYQNPITHGVSTTVHSDGYTTDCASMTTAPSALQRSVEERY
jgi:hypothetical protein